MSYTFLLITTVVYLELAIFYRFSIVLLFLAFSAFVNGKQRINALYIPLADHYAAIVAYEKFRKQMKHANFTIEQMPNWDLLKTKFLDRHDDMAFVMSPLAMEMFNKQPTFKWIGLMHRDGNGLAVSHAMADYAKLPVPRHLRKPLGQLKPILTGKDSFFNRIVIGVPHLKSTHSVVLYAYLKQQGLTLSLSPNYEGDVLALAVPPSQSPAFILANSNRNRMSGIEQSLPWIDIAETDGYGKVAWYSKDVLPTELGHVECIALASNLALQYKPKAVREVFRYIHLAGHYIEQQRALGEDAMADIITMIQRHIPAHSKQAILASLDKNLRLINYNQLKIDKLGLKKIMDIAVEAKILSKPIDIDDFAADEYSEDKTR